MSSASGAGWAASSSPSSSLLARPNDASSWANASAAESAWLGAPGDLRDDGMEAAAASGVVDGPPGKRRRGVAGRRPALPAPPTIAGRRMAVGLTSAAGVPPPPAAGQQPGELQAACAAELAAPG